MKHVDALDAMLTQDARQRLRMFEALLLRWNVRINLVARADMAELWPRHILDSAQLARLLPPGAGDLADLGSGAGFPGLVLAIVTGRHVHLVESDQRKAAFLREAVRATHADAVVHAMRAESLVLPSVAVVTARALAPLNSLLGLAAPLLTRDSVCLFPKGRSANSELTAAANEWHMRVTHHPSLTNPGATILRISEIRRAGRDL